MIAFTYMIEEMRAESVELRGACGPFVDTHGGDTYNKHAAFGWHADDQGEADGRGALPRDRRLVLDGGGGDRQVDRRR